MDDKITVIVADIDKQQLDECVRMFMLSSKFKLISYTVNANELLMQIQNLRPQIVLIGSSLADCSDTTQIIPQIKQLGPVNIVFMADNKNLEILSVVLQAGVNEVVFKPLDWADLEYKMANLVVKQFSKPSYSQDIPGIYTSHPGLDMGYNNIMSPQQYQQPYGVPGTGNQTNPGQSYMPGNYPGINIPPNNPINPIMPGGQMGYQTMGPTGPMPGQMSGNIPNFNIPDPMTKQQASGKNVVLRTIKQTVICVSSPKGGVGKSTCSKELALAYQMAANEFGTGNSGTKPKIALIDLDVENGDIGNLLNLPLVPNITTWALDISAEYKKNGGDINKIHFSFDEIVDNYMVIHQDSGLYVLNPPATPIDAANINEEVVNVILNNLENIFDVIVIDCGTSFTGYLHAAWQRADVILMILRAEFTNIRNVYNTLQIFPQANLSYEKVRYLFNAVPKKTDWDLTDIVHTINREINYDIPIIGVIPTEDMASINNRKSSVLIEKPNSQAAYEIRRVANEIVPMFSRKKIVSKGFSFDSFKFWK